FQRVDQAGSGDDGRAVLVVVEDRDVHQFAQPAFDDEALRRLDVLQVDAAEGRAEKADTVDELVDIFRIHFEIDGIDIGKTLEEDGLALHHRFGGQRTEIAKAENGRAVRDHRNHV